MGFGNAILAALVALPSLVFYRAFLHCGLGLAWCKWGVEHPLALLNLMFFLNVTLLFWIISLIQASTWLIDPYWTFLPVLMAHYFAAHPSSRYDPKRSRTLLLLVWIWSIRLTHSYFRREKWQWGAREDWRFAEMRRKYGSNWWWISFFAAYVSQQMFLVGICLPVYAVHQSQVAFNKLDAVIAAVCLTGIAIAYFADTQLHEFVTARADRRRSGVLRTGLWKLSRHPNYCGEQLWWWGVALLGWNAGQPWTMVGAVVNSLCLAYVTLLVERRMLSSHGERYAEYRKQTSVWIPGLNLFS